MNNDALLQVSEIVSHAACPDGIGAAMICNAAYIARGMDPPPTNFVQYGRNSHNFLQARPRQLFVDITPPKDRWEEWTGLSPIVLDHHETVMHIVHELNGVYGDSNRSGAMLAYENVFIPLASEFSSDDDKAMWERFAYLCMVRDTWKSASPDWSEACSLAHALLLHGQEWGVTTTIAKGVTLEDLTRIGSKIYGKIERQAKGIIKHSAVQELNVNGTSVRIAFFNHAHGGSTSDLAHFIIDGMPCNAAIGYFFTHEDGEMKTVISMRTNGTILASEIARSFGGGGHAKAAGFTISGDIQPSKIVKMVSDRLVELANK